MRFGAAFWINRTDWPDLREAALLVSTRRAHPEAARRLLDHFTNGC